MNLTFNECVKLIWIYFGIRTGFAIIWAIPHVISWILEQATILEKNEQRIEENESYSPDVQIETEQTGRNNRSRVIGFVSNKMEDT
jgi:hypothetical protein